MKIDDSIFAVKLYEMAEQYGKLQCRIRVCEQGDSEKIRSELKKAEEEFEENTLLLEEKAGSCRSSAVKKLSKAQFDYRQKAQQILADNREKLDELAEYLYDKETITGDEFMQILNS